MLRESGVHQRYRAWFVRPVSRLLHRLGVVPATLSVAALLVAVAGGVAFVFEPALGGALYLLSGVIDTLDGAVSRREGTSSRAGAFLDSLLDRYADLLILLGVIGFYASAGLLTTAAVCVVFLAGYGSFLVSYAQSRAEGLGSDCSFGWYERPERVLLLAFGAMASRWIEVRAAMPDFLALRPVLGMTLVFLALGANVTAFTRLRRGYRELRRDDEPSRIIDRLASYLAAEFPSHALSREWDTGRRVLVYRLVSQGKTMLVEVSAEALDTGGAPPTLVQRIERWDLPTRLREHLRVLVTPRGLEALPWKQLSPVAAVTDEEIRESFPASDASSPSSIT